MSLLSSFSLFPLSPSSPLPSFLSLFTTPFPSCPSSLPPSSLPPSSLPPFLSFSWIVSRSLQHLAQCVTSSGLTH